jgi:D-threo-aldose 1-dehydrogenase
VNPAGTLGLGGGPLGGLFAPVSEETATAVVERAWERGLRLFDVAPFYGHGRSERFMGQVLREKPREEFVLSTKVGRLLRPEAAGGASDFVETGGVGPVFDFTRDGVRRSLEESLERMGLDRVDVALIHDPEDHLDQAIAEAQPALAQLRDQDVVKAIGVGTNSCASAVRILRETDVDWVLLANRITLLDQSGVSEVLPLCDERDVTLVAGGVFNSGVLASPHGDTRFDYRLVPDEVQARAVALEQVCERHGVPLATAAVQYPLRHAGVDGVLIGVRNVDELDANIAAFEADVPAALWDELP